VLESGTPEVPQAAAEVSVTLDGDALTRTVQKGLVARFSVPMGKHVYVYPALHGSVSANLVLDENEHRVQRPLVRPMSELHTLTGTDESFRVHHGVFELRLPITVNGAEDSGAAAISVSGKVRWQSCDDEVCDKPANVRFELELPVAETPAFALRSRKGVALAPNAKAHFKRMSERRSERPTK
jgi:hypothetical protein